MNDPHSNLASLLTPVVAQRPHHAAIVEGTGARERRIAYGRLLARVEAFAGGLAERGIARGDAVLIFVPMSIDLYVALLGCLHLGAVAVFIDAWAGRGRLDDAIERAQPKALVAVPKAHLLKLVSARLRKIPIQILTDRDWFPLDRVERPARAAAPADVPADHPALITFTTGSTGRPKAAARTHGFLVAQHRAINRELRVGRDDVDLPGLPVFVLNDLAVGATAVLPDADPRKPAEMDPATIYGQIERHSVTTASGSPAFFERLSQWCAREGRKLPLRTLHTGGAPVSPMLARILADQVRGKVHVVYGSTEAEPMAAIEARDMLSVMVPRDAAGNPPDGVCVGVPVTGLALRLIRPDDGPLELGESGWDALDVAPGEVGEVAVCGEWVLTSYFQNPEADHATKIRDGDQVWHRTGDAARMDDKGRLWLMGRVSRRIRRDGKVWWSIPGEVRALKVQGIRHAAYIGMPDDRYGEKAVLCVEILGDELLPVECEKLRSALAPMPVDEIYAVRRIPRDPRHDSKTDVGALLDLLARTEPQGT